jgi:sorting nexin-1/2
LYVIISRNTTFHDHKWTPRIQTIQDVLRRWTQTCLKRSHIGLDYATRLCFLHQFSPVSEILGMDGFDDLLAPSRNALEENPFEDPFAKRSGSPDPWSSGWTRSEHHYSSEPEEHAGFEEQSTQPESLVAAGQHEANEPSHSSDPLDSAAQTADYDDEDEDDRPLGRPRTSPTTSPHTPGFRESVPIPFSETATIRPTVPEELEPSTPAQPYSPVDNKPSAFTFASQPIERVDSSSSRAAFVSHSPSTSKSGSAVVSPLETASSGLDHSFAGLALGGDSVGGWQVDQGSWTNDSPAARARSDDSDDEPIRKPSQAKVDEQTFVSALISLIEISNS